MALYLARLGHSVILVPRRPEHAEELAQERKNTSYLPGFPFENTIIITADISSALASADLVFLACPSMALRSLCETIKTKLHNKHSIKCIISLCKGLEKETFLTPTAVIQSILPELTAGALSGPTYASEVARGQPTASTFTTHGSLALMQEIQESISSSQLRVYRSTDVAGVEYASCLKNVYAIGAGICDGLQLGDNAKAAYLTRTLNELVRLGVCLGGEPGTFYGLSGFGDLVATCFGAWSRNRTFGEQMAHGSDAQAIMMHQKTVVEGYWATACFHNLLESRGMEAPILNEIHAVLYTNKPSRLALENLMTRELKAET